NQVEDESAIARQFHGLIVPAEQRDTELALQGAYAIPDRGHRYTEALGSLGEATFEGHQAEAAQLRQLDVLEAVVIHAEMKGNADSLLWCWQSSMNYAAV